MSTIHSDQTTTLTRDQYPAVPLSLVLAPVRRRRVGERLRRPAANLSAHLVFGTAIAAALWLLAPGTSDD
jgi:hypothetical protein